MENNAKIDVIIPVYNGEKYIIQAISSAINQTLKPQRVIVVNDGSTDSTEELLKEHAKQSPIEIQIVNKKNGGLSSARNEGIKNSTADFIAFLDADDIWAPNKIEKQIEVFRNTSYPDLGLVYCDYDLIDTAGNKDSKSYKVTLDKNVRGSVFHKVLPANKILSSGSGVLIKKEVFEKVGMFDENLKFGEDWDMWIRIAKKYEVDYSEEVLVHIRRHGQNMTSLKRNVFIGELAFYKKWIPILKENNQQIPTRWRIKVLYRLFQQLPHTDLIREALPIFLIPFR